MKKFSHQLLIVLFILSASMLFEQDTLAETSAAHCAVSKHDAGEQPDSNFAVINNKIKLLHKIIYESSNSKRIMDSGNPEAINLLEQARHLYMETLSLIENQCVDMADNNLNMALKHAQDASRYAVNEQRLDESEKLKYKTLVDRYETFHVAYARLKQQGSSDKTLTQQDDSLNSLTATAAGYAEQKDYKQANLVMSKAVTALEDSLTKALDNTTLIHEYKFESLEQEYSYSIGTNESYTRLLEIILQNMNEDNPRFLLIKNLLQRNDEILSEAEGINSTGDTKSALAIIEKSNMTMIRALSFTGVGK